MATEKQIAANRRNAQKSTGPRTEEGRSISRLNAFKHGLTGHLDVMTADEKAAHDAFIAGIVDDLKPVGVLESQVANSIAEGYWRMNRVVSIENNLFAEETHNRQADPAAESEPSEIETALASARAFIAHPERFQLLTIYEMRLHRKIKSDLSQLREFQTVRRAEEDQRASEQRLREHGAFKESCDLLESRLHNGEPVDLQGDISHPHGFVYSIPELLESMTADRLRKRAKMDAGCYPLSTDQLQSFLEQATAA